MSASELVNAPVRFRLGEESVHARRLGKLEIMALAEDYVIERRLRLVGDGQAAPDEDMAQRAIELVLSNRPPTSLIMRWLSAAIVKPALSEEQLYALADQAPAEQIAALVGHILSMKEPADDRAQPDSAGA